MYFVIILLEDEKSSHPHWAKKKKCRKCRRQLADVSQLKETVYALIY